jgi:hypothetical protein
MAIATVGDDEDLFDRALKASAKGKGDQSESADIFDRVLQKAAGGKVAPAQPAAITQAPAKPAAAKTQDRTEMKGTQAERDRGRAEILLQERQSIVDRLSDSKLTGDDRLREEKNLEAINREIGTLPANLRQPPVAAPVTPVAAAAPAAAPAAPKPAAPAAPAPQPKVAGLGERLLRSGAGLADTVLGGIQALPGTAAAEIGYAGVRGAEALGLVEPGRAERGRAAVYKKFVEPYTQPVGQALGVTETPEYKGEASQQLMKFIGENVSKGVDWLSRTTGLPKADIENMMATAGLAAPAASKALVSEARMIAGAVKPEPKPPTARVEPTMEGRVEPTMTGRASVGAAAVPDAMTVRQALAVASPELRAEISRIPADKVNLKALQRQIEADSIGVRLTEGQAIGDPIKLSNEMNRRGRDTEIATRLNEQNQRLIDAIDETKDIASPDAFGARTMDNGQAIIDAYKALDNKLNVGIDAKYKALRDAAGGQFPVDAPLLLKNVQTKLKKELLSNDAPPSQFKELERLASENAMTFEDFLSLRRNLGQIARTSPDGNVRTAAGYMIEELEKLPLQEGAKKLKPLADQARKAARDRFQMLEKDPAYRAVVNNKIAPDNFIDKFVIGGVNQNIQTMLSHLDDTSRQHMAAGVINYLRERGVPAGGNFKQSGYNNALTALDKSDKLSLIFDPESASRLRTIGAVGKYTQAQPAGYFGNHSNTFVSALAERAKATVGRAAETSLNIAIPGAQIGSAVMEARARRAAAKETQRALKPGAGIRNE